MRAKVACALLLLMTGAPPAAAQAPEWTSLLEDEAGDVERDAPLPPALQDGRADLLRVEARATATTIAIRLVSGERDGLGWSEPTFASLVDFAIETSGERAEFTLRVDDEGFHLDGGSPQGALARGNGWPYEYTVELRRDELMGGAMPGETIRVMRAQLLSEDERFRTRDEGAGGAPLPLPDPPEEPVSRIGMRGWVSVEGVDYAGGPSIAAGPDGSVHLAYFVYKADLLDIGTRPGLYHATLVENGRRIVAERVADQTMPGPVHQAFNSTTAIAVDEQGAAHILHYPRPWSGSGIRYVADAGGVWRSEDPSAGVLATDDVRSTASIAARGGRLVAAFQAADDSIALVERRDGAWTLLRTIEGARLPRVALDSAAGVHVAWLEPREDGHPDRGVSGPLLYASEAGGWEPMQIAPAVMDDTRFTGRAEGSGSFDFTLAPDDAAHFVWESERDGRGYTIVRDGDKGTTSTPLVPVHGNPQLRMRLDVDARGRGHVASGYGGLDLYALRSPEDGWLVQTMDRVDMADLAVRHDGTPVIVGTRPHGGTTLAVLTQRAPPAEPDALEAAEADPERARLAVPLPAVVTLVGIALVARARAKF